MNAKTFWATRGPPLAAVVVYAVLGLASPSAVADSLSYYTGFEKPEFLPGPLNGQEEWQNPQKSALVLPVKPAEGRQAIQVLGAKLSPVVPGLLLTRFGRFAYFDPSDDGGVVGVGVDVKLEGPITGDDLVSANLFPFLADANDPTVPIYIGEAYLSSNGYVYVTDPTGDYVTQYPVGGMEVYHRIGALIDFANGTVQWCVDGFCDGAEKVDASIGPTDIFAMGALAMLAIDDRALVNPGKYRARFDNYCVASGDGAEGCAMEGLE